MYAIDNNQLKIKSKLCMHIIDFILVLCHKLTKIFLLYMGFFLRHTCMCDILYLIKWFWYFSHCYHGFDIFFIAIRRVNFLIEIIFKTWSYLVILALLSLQMENEVLNMIGR